MVGFHKLESFWKIEYEAETLEPFITQATSEEAKEEVDSILSKKLPKTLLDSVPLVMGDRAVITGNAVKGVFRHVLSAQLTEAGHEVCVQEVKLPKPKKSKEDKEKLIPEGRKEQCTPEDPCFVCMWFGTASMQGALYFSFLKSSDAIKEILLEEPIPMIAVDDKTKAVAERAFLLIAPVKEGTKFVGWITGENLSEEIIGAIKEVVDMSKKGFIKFGGYRTRGYGTVKFEIKKLTKYSTVPFKKEFEYEGEKLSEFLNNCQEKYHEYLTKNKKE